MMDLAEVDRRFNNIEAIWNDGNLAIKLFDDRNRAKAFKSLSNLFRLLDNSSEIFEPLLGILSHIHWDLRGFVAVSEEQSLRWSSNRAQLRNQLALLQNYMTLESKNEGTELIAALELLERKDESYQEAIVETLAGDGFKVLVVEKPRLRATVTDYINELGKTEQVLVVSLANFVKLQLATNLDVIILAAPRKLTANFMRLLCYGAPVQKMTFLSPNWLAGQSPQKVTQDLAPGLRDFRKPVLFVSGPLFDEILDDSSIEEAEASISPSSQTSFEKFVEGGDVPCRLVYLSDNRVMPVELEATRVSVLSKSEDGNLRVDTKHPFRALEAGDVIFDLSQGVEETFLAELAEAKMGFDFFEFSQGKSVLRKRLRQLIESKGFVGTVEYLLHKGVSSARNLEYWLDNEDLTTLRSVNDWHNLLKALDFKPAEVNRLEVLGAKLRSTLISIGLEARKQMADSITSREYDEVLSGTILLKRLEEYGDADFVIAMVKSVSADQVMARAENIRKVMEI